MNETIRTLKTRCSTRQYLDTQVPDDLLDAVLDAGIYAPSGMNNQKIYAVAVRDRETRDLLSGLNAGIMNTDSDPFYGAPCVIVVLADPTVRTWVEDGSLLMGNLLNAAASLGLASCWIHINNRPCLKDEPEGARADNYVSRLLGIKDGFHPYCAIAIGYPEE